MLDTHVLRFLTETPPPKKKKKEEEKFLENDDW